MSSAEAFFTWHSDARFIDNAGQAIDYAIAQDKISALAVKLDSQAHGRIVAIDVPDATQRLLAIFGAIAAGLEFLILDPARAKNLAQDRFLLFSHRDKPEGFSNAKTKKAARYFNCLSSGTTGKPKAVRRSHLSWINSFGIIPIDHAVTASSRVAIFGDLQHSLALYGALEALYLGAELHLLQGLGPKVQHAETQRRNITTIYATPSQLRLIVLNQFTKRQFECSGVQDIYIGGSALDTKTATQIAEIYPNARVFNFYGASETSFVSVTDAESPAGSTGCACRNVHLEIREEDNMKLPANTLGQIWVKSPYLFDSYTLGASSETRWHDGYMTIGETGYLDGNGNVFVKGRTRRMAVIAEQNVALDDIEDQIRSFTNVAEIAVIAVDDALRGQILEAAVLPTKNSPGLAEIKASCRKVLGPLVAPKKLIIHDPWPLLASGKTDYNAITLALKRSPK